MGKKTQTNMVTSIMSQLQFSKRIFWILPASIFFGCASPQHGVDYLASEYEVFQGYRVAPAVLKNSEERLDIFIGVPEDPKDEPTKGERVYREILYCIAENPDEGALPEVTELLMHDVNTDRLVFLYGIRVKGPYKHWHAGLDCIVSAIAIYHPGKQGYVYYNTKYGTPFREWFSVRKMLQNAVKSGGRAAVKAVTP